MQNNFTDIADWILARWIIAPWWGKCVYAGLVIYVLNILLCAIVYYNQTNEIERGNDK